MEDETLIMTMLFDFFGDLLTEKQSEYFDLYHNEDFSLSEIAERAGITRQGVYDIINRAEKALTEIEQKTGVVQRWICMRAELERAEETARELLQRCDGDGKYEHLARELIGIIENIADKG